MKLRGADVVARALACAGTRYVFTLSGNHVMSVFDAALEAKLPLLHVRHEAAAEKRRDPSLRAVEKLVGQDDVARPQLRLQTAHRADR